MSQNSFKRESLLELALLIVSSRDSYSADIANYKQEWLNSFEEGTICKRDDFLKERGTWDINVFIPGITDEVKRERVFYLWRQKGTKNRTGNARKENKELAEELAAFDDVFNDIANQMFGVPKSGFKRPRDNAEDEQQLYETGSEEIEFGIEVLKKLFPLAKTILECCAGNGAMVRALEAHGYNVIALDKYPKDDTVQQCDMYNDHFPPEFDVVFTNPPFKNKADFFNVMYEECIMQGKGFCIMLPFESDSQLGVMKSIERMIYLGLLQKVTMEWPPVFIKDGKECKPVGMCSWYVGGSMVVLDEKKLLKTYSFKKDEKP